MKRALLGLGCVLFSCKEEPPAPYTGAPRQVISFTLPRALTHITLDAKGEQLLLTDPQVVRLLDNTGTELWGRRLSIGALQRASFCNSGIAVLGENGHAFLSMDGLQRPWPGQICELPDTDAPRAAYQDGVLRFYPQPNTAAWEKFMRCEAPCPTTLWGGFVAVGEGSVVGLYAQSNGVPKASAIGLGEPTITTLDAAANTLVLGKSEGTVEIWQGRP